LKKKPKTRTRKKRIENPNEWKQGQQRGNLWRKNQEQPKKHLEVGGGRGALTCFFLKSVAVIGNCRRRRTRLSKHSNRMTGDWNIIGGCETCEGGGQALEKQNGAEAGTSYSGSPEGGDRGPKKLAFEELRTPVKEGRGIKL